MRRFLFFSLIFGLLTSAVFGQAWLTAYEGALADARTGNWEKAREGFKQAYAYRTEDVSGPTMLPGPATERKRWRNGSPYSPNFLAAYCSYRVAQGSVQQDQRNKNLTTASSEWNALVAKGQVSYETVYFLTEAYRQLGDVQKIAELEQKLQSNSAALTWKVDTEPVAPEELAVVAQMGGNVSRPSGGGNPKTNPGNPPATGGTATGVAPSYLTRVPVVATKYALIVGNSESRMSGVAVPFAAEDAMLIREALISSAGYAEANIDLIQNATSNQLVAAAKALADRIPDGATVFIYFAGAGVNANGKDYLAGVDSEQASDVNSMLAKGDLYSLFVKKGARVFAFFETDRPVANGRYFGMEVPMFGSVAQSQGTIPGEGVYSLVRNGRTIGLYADALSTVISKFRSNRIPIHEFGWQVFYTIRKGDTGEVPGASRQTPTLPVLTNMASDARF